MCKVVSSQRGEKAGQESSPQHSLLPFRRQGYSTVAAGRAPFASVTTARCMLAMVFSRARLRVRLSWRTLILLRHVLSIHRHLCEDG